MGETTYIKLKDLVGQTVTIEKVFPPKWVKWDDTQGKYVMAHGPEKGFQKKYTADTNKGRVDFSSSQVGQMLEAACDDGRSDLNGTYFAIKSNGKSGMEIRYWFNFIEQDQSHEPEPFEEQLPEGF